MGIPADASYNTLRVEFETNALYSPAYAAGDNNTVCLLANAIAFPQYEMDVTQVDARAVQSVVIQAEFDVLELSKQANWQNLLTTSEREGFIVRDSGYRQQVADIWGGTATLTAFQALQKRDATEFEAFWDLAFEFDTLSCTVDDVRQARATG